MSKKRSNGDGTLRKRSDGRWECRVMNGTCLDGKPKYKTFYGKTQKEVREKLKKFQSNLADGIVDSGVTFEQWADNWFNGYKGKVSEATYEGYRYTVRILKNYFGKQLLKDIKPMHVELFLEQQKSEGRSDSYVAKLRGMLFQILNKAEANDLIRKNPVRYAEKRRTEGEAKPKDAFTAEEIKLLFAQLPMNRIGLSIRIMIATGLRSQEMLALQTEHVEPDGSVIHVRQAVKLVKGTVSIGPTKSRDSVRDVPVPESVRQYVVMLLALQINGYLWGSPKTNTPVNPSWFRTSFEAALEKIEGVRKLTPHCCRHTYVSHLQAMGVDIQTIQYLSGHAEIKMTEHYLHVQNSVKTKAVEKLDAFLSAC